MRIPGRIIYDNRVRYLTELAATSSSWEDEELLFNEDPCTRAAIGGSASANYFTDIDLGSAQSIDGFAMINHDLISQEFTYLLLITGSPDNGTTWDEYHLIISPFSSYPELEPSFCAHFSAVSRRYWRVQFGVSPDTDDVHVGALVLGTTYDFEKHPAAPRELPHEDFTESERGLGGYETVRGDAPPYWTHDLLWYMALGGAGHLVDELKAIDEAQDGALHPVVFVDHRRVRNHTTYDLYPCSYCVINSLEAAEVWTDGTDHRFDVNMVLEEIGFDGIL